MEKEYTNEIESKRRTLRPILLAARQHPNYKGKCKLEEDKLILRGKKYTVDTIHELPQDMNGYTSSSKTDETTVGFFGELSPFSNFHPSKIEYLGQTYHSAEQAIQYEKARYYNDISNMEKI